MNLLKQLVAHQPLVCLLRSLAFGPPLSPVLVELKARSLSSHESLLWKGQPTANRYLTQSVRRCLEEKKKEIRCQCHNQEQMS